MTGFTVSRRGFLRVTSVAGAYLLGFRFVPGCRDQVGWAGAEGELNAWIRITPDDVVTLTISESEMGQGIMTALSMVLAEELDADWSKVAAQPAPADRDRYGGQSTGGSTSVRQDYEPFRVAGAAAREMLIAAAETWGVAPASCRTERGYVLDESGDRRMSYGRLAARAAEMPVPTKPTLKDPSTFRIVGHDTKRLDTPDKVTGRAVFGIDVSLPDMLIAQVERVPVFGGAVRSFDATAALQVPGVRHVVEIPSGVAVVADNFWAAKRGRDALTVTWDEGPDGTLDSAQIRQRCRDIVSSGTEARREGNPDTGLRAAAKTLDAVYEVPYLAHAPMEPLNCTADVRADRCEIWVPTQSPSGSQGAARQITGLSAAQVIVHTTYLGGGFGRRSQTDFVKDAVHTSRAVGKPVKVIWTREDDVRGGYYRPAAYNEFRGGVDANGWPSVWVHKIASPSILLSLGAELDGDLDPTGTEGAANLPYGIPHMQVTWAHPDSPITLHWWRSVGSSQNAYVTECFFDELCQLGGVDPVEARRRLLGAHVRHRRALDTAAAMAGWGSAVPAGHARGVAVHESFGSIVAQVADVSLRSDGTPRVHHVWCAVDCGIVINPDTVRAQIESGIMYGLSAALHGELTIERGRVMQSNFHDYPVVRMHEAPSVDVTIIAEGDPIGGIGEPGLPPIAPAVCNALLRLTGKPVRKLPIGRMDA